MAETKLFPDYLIRSFLLNPKYNYTVPLCKKIRGTIGRKELVYALQEELVMYSVRQFGINDMELETVRVRNIVWMGGYTRDGLRPTWSL